MATSWHIARAAIQAQEWGEIQQTYTLAPGVYGFSCAGHGGIAAVYKDVLHRWRNGAIPKWGLLMRDREQVVWERKDGRSFYITADTYHRQMGYRSGPRKLLPGRVWLPGDQAACIGHKVFVLEEDCDWALAALCFEGLDWSTYTSFTTETEALQHAREVADRWLRKEVA